jgi:homoserine O-acetyltransferase
MMNQLLKTIDITRNRSSFENTIETEAEIHIIAINSDLFFTAENKTTFEQTTKNK